MNEKMKWLTWGYLFQCLGGAILVIALAIMAHESGVIGCGINKAIFCPLNLGPVGKFFWFPVMSTEAVLWEALLMKNTSHIMAAVGFATIVIASLPWRGLGYHWMKILSFVFWPVALLFAPYMYRNAMTHERKIFANFVAAGAAITFAFIFAIW